MAQEFLSAFQIRDILLQSLQFLCLKQTPYNPLSTAEIVDPAQDGRHFTGGRLTINTPNGANKSLLAARLPLSLGI